MSREQFFTTMYQKLLKHKDVHELRRLPDVFVPVMKFQFNQAERKTTHLWFLLASNSKCIFTKLTMKHYFLFTKRSHPLCVTKFQIALLAFRKWFSSQTEIDFTFASLTEPVPEKESALLVKLVLVHRSHSHNFFRHFIIMLLLILFLQGNDKHELVILERFFPENFSFKNLCMLMGLNNCYDLL